MKSQYFVIKNLNGEKRFVEVDEELTAEEFMAYFSLYVKDTFNKLGYKAEINTHTTSCINLFLDIYLYSEYRLIYC